MLHAELKSKIRKLWDKFWSGGISNPLQAIEQKTNNKSNSKTYKLFIHDNLNMIPGDPTGLPDESFRLISGGSV